MILQSIVDGLVVGCTLSLGAIGLTLTYDILRFANFAHGEFATLGAYFALSVVALLGTGTVFAPFTFGANLLLALVLAMVLTAGLALLLDGLLFRPLRRSEVAVALVIASFGASLMLRNVAVFVWGPQPAYYARSIAIVREWVPGVRFSADEGFVVVCAAALMVALHAFLAHTRLGREMRAVADNPSLARVAGIDVARVIRWVWVIGGGLAAVAGVLFGLTVQVTPEMGFNLILPLFAAAILGGIGSVHGAMLGGLIIGLAQSLAVPLLGAAYKPAVAFGLMFLILLVYPRGLLGDRTGSP